MIAEMTFAGLCEMAQANGWAITLAAENEGNTIEPGGGFPGSRLRTLALYESRKDWRNEVPMLAVRLVDPERTLDEAAELIVRALGTIETP